MNNYFIILFTIFLVITGKSFSQDGTIDLTFNPVDVGFGFGDGPNLPVLASAIQSDGKMMIVGEFTKYNGISKNYLVRINENGAIDSTFNIGTGSNDIVEHVLVQPDGKIVIIGVFTSYNGTARNGIARLNSDGTIDMSFNPGSGVTGIMVDDFLIQPDGKLIIAGGFGDYNGIAISKIARINVDGSLDMSFNPGTGVNTAVSKIALQTDGKIVVGGNFMDYNGTSILNIARLYSDGTLDTSFNPGTSTNGIILSILIDPNGKIIIGGSFTIFNGVGREKIARINNDGSLDNSFNPGTGTNNNVKCMALQNDGKILIGGAFTMYNGNNILRVARVNSDGTLDAGFHANEEPYFMNVYCISIQTNGKILVGGYFTYYDNVVNINLANLNSNGTLDTNFNNEGKGADFGVNTTLVQPDGKIIIGGNFTSYNGVYTNRIARLNSDGSIDSGFNIGSGVNGTITSTCLQPDGKILIGGVFTTVNGVNRKYVARLNSDGSYDNTFDPGTGMGTSVNAISYMPNGKILIAGTFSSFDDSICHHIVRLNSNGSFDNSFNSTIGPNSSIYALKVQTDGKIIIGGDFITYDGIAIKRIARLNEDGTLDTSFNPGVGTNAKVNDITLQTDGKLIIGGQFTTFNGNTCNRIARLNTNGSYDASFSSYPAANSEINVVKFQPDGKILVGGYFTTYNGSSINRIVRLNSNGTVDTGFDLGTGTNLAVLSINFQNNADIMIGGSFTAYGTTGRNRIARINNCFPVVTTDVISTCDNITWIDGNIYASNNNTATYLLTSSNGCDSLVTLNLTINNNSGIDFQSACDSLFWIDGNTYYSNNNTATYTLTNSAGCDSIVTLNLTINQFSSAMDVSVACDSLIWIDGITYYSSTNSPIFTITNSMGCDSVVYLDLTILNSSTGIDVQFACDSLMWMDGITYYMSTNIPTWTLTNSQGCDSIVTLDLTIIPSLPIWTNSFSIPSDASNCNGELSVSTTGNSDFILDIDAGLNTQTSGGYSLISNLCPGVHSLFITDYCGDTLNTTFVIPVDSNYVYNNPYIDSMAIDSLGATISNCNIYYNSIDTAYIDSIFATGNIVNVIWNIVNSNGSNFDTSTYILNNGSGVYALQLSVFCPTKAIGDYFTVTEYVYIEIGYASIHETPIDEFDLFEIYPNPSSDYVHLKFEGSQGDLKIMDANGRIISNSRIFAGDVISLKELENGLYFLELTTYKGNKVRRLVKE